MKKILLPTDLTGESLKPIHEILKRHGNGEVEIYVIHFISTPTSIGDLFFINQKKPYHALPEDFMNALQLIKHEYLPHSGRIKFDFVYCNTSRYFRNYLDANMFDAIYVLANYTYTEPLEVSENIISFLNKVRIPVIHVERKVVSYSEYLDLSSLLVLNEKRNKRPYVTKEEYTG